MVTTHLVQAPASRQHAHHARVGGVDVGKQEQWANRRVGGMNRKMREGPYGVVEDRDVRPLGGQAASLVHRYLAGSDRLRAADHLMPRGLAGGSDACLHFRHERGDALVHEVTPIAKAEDPNPRHSNSPFLGATTE